MWGCGLMKQQAQGLACSCIFILATALCSLAPAQSLSSNELSGAMRRLWGHIAGESRLDASAIDQARASIEENVEEIGTNPRILRQALYLAAAYEAAEGPLFINEATRRGFRRQPTEGRELEHAVFALQQGIIDHAYTPENLQRFHQLLNGAAFETSAYFPGTVEVPIQADAVYSVSINASQPACWGIPVMYSTDPARRPTGCYLVPGSLARVDVPASMIGKGYGIRVGAHSWDLSKKPLIKRLDRVSIVYPIDQARTWIANPLGGGIYIEVPYEADAGEVQIQLRNVVRSPYFSAKSFDQTTLEEWRNIERSHPGPWADFESDKFMMQVPTKWIYAFDDPVTLLKDWDTAMDAVSRLFGFPLIRNKTVLYLQVDVILRGSANFPGYPQSNTPYDPHRDENGNSGHWLLKGPQHGGATIFHELGHAQLFTKFKGEVEAVVNLPYVAVLNNGFGVDLDTAFGKSFHKDSVSLDQAAIMWMVTENFRQGNPMDISNSEANEVRYQHRGYAKYVEMVHLFGWEVLEKFWQSNHADYAKGIEYPRNADPTDNRILRLSQNAGADLTPLVHFWGVQPADGPTLKSDMARQGLKPSLQIYERLLHYQAIIPMNNAAFAEHARIVNPKGIRSGGSPLYGTGWYHATLPTYNQAHGEAAQAALQAIIDTYFPDGPPQG